MNAASPDESTVALCDELQTEEMVALDAIFPDGFQWTPAPAPLARRGFLAVDVVLPSSDLAVEVDQPVAKNLLSSATVQSLPPATVDFALPLDYPADSPARVSVRCSWLPEAALASLSEAATDAASAAGSDVALFEVHAAVAAALETFLAAASPLRVAPGALETIVHHDQNVRRAAFRSQQYTCLICLYPRFGKDAVALPGCGHLFCRACLHDFFVVLVDNGMPHQVRCPHPDCAPSARGAAAAGAPDAQEAELDAEAQLAAHPVTAAFLTDLIGAARTAKWTEQFLNRAYASDPSMLWCARVTCGGPARRATDGVYTRLATCLHCKYAFCAHCNRGWHGNAQGCAVRDQQGALKAYLDARADPDPAHREKRVLELLLRYGRATLDRLLQAYEDEQATLAWVRDNAAVCPRCATPVIKSDGCNHMSCATCGAHFCYICGTGLDGLANKYDHFTKVGSSCRGKLFEGLVIDEEANELAAVQIAFGEDW
ncbi:hypothetical protein H9P43_004648 [Blastocladiella emersonii ATCC 22665]|nr:hypothetical protein H9P43_004648 [Blastocladiella emersonii ATCC 22665]